MNYIELVSAIKSRPKFFLRETNIYELDAFLRGVSYVNFSNGVNGDLYKLFTNEWIPSKFGNITHDWIDALTNNENYVDPFEYFFILWDEFKKEFVPK